MAVGLHPERSSLSDRRPVRAAEEPLDFPLGDPDHSPEPPDRVSAIWQAKWWILAAAVIVAAVVLAVCSVISPTYESAATVRISLPPNQSNLSSQGVSAS